jgi:hypothetical protein
MINLALNLASWLEYCCYVHFDVCVACDVGEYGDCDCVCMTRINCLQTDVRELRSAGLD